MNYLTTSCLLLFFLLSTSVNAQSWWNSERIKGNGELKTETRDLSGFTRIAACCGFKVELTEGDFDFRVEAESNLLPYLRSEVNGSELSLGWKKGVNVNTRETVRIYVSLPKLRGLDISSSCSVRGQSTFHGEDLDLETSSAGSIDLAFEGGEVEANTSSGSEIILRGAGSRLRADASSGSKIEAGGLEVADGRAEASSGARVELNVSERLRADASSGGSVRYRGNPSDLDTDASSGGSVRKQ